MLDPAAAPHFNLAGWTQFRLRFELDDDDDLAADYLEFFSGNELKPNSRPVLLVKYHIP